MRKRKSGIVLLLICAMFLLSVVEAGAQGNKVSLTCNDTPLPSALSQVERQSGYYKLNYNYDELSRHKVTVSITEQTAPEAVGRLLRGLPFGYTVNGKFINVSRNAGKAGNGGSGKARGRLLDRNGDPLIGATVKVVGTDNATVTDTDGNYQLDGVGADDVIEYSYIGMKTYRRKYSDKNVSIIMDDDSNVIGNVVVTGMQQMDRRLFTGSTVMIDAAEAKLDGVPDISRSLEGRVAGVSVQNVTGTFGTAPKIHVRGATSIYGNSTPLWVVDGVIQDDIIEVSTDRLSSGDAVTLISSAVANLNADDIESFQILKDGSATSIYGARGMAGVIVVTTKKGVRSKPRVHYSGEYTMRLKPHYSEFNIMNSQEQMGVYRELQQKGWLNYSDTHRAASSGVYGKMYQLMNTYNPQTGTFMLANTPEAKAEYLMQSEYRNTDWFDELFKNTIAMNHSVSLSVGNERSRTYAALSAMLDDGWYQDNSVERYTAHLNTTIDLNDRLRLNMIATSAFRKQKAPGTLNQDVDPFYGEVSRDFDINPYSYAINASRTLDADEFYRRYYTDFNIKHELDNNSMDIDMSDVKFQAQLDWRLVFGLELTAMGAVRYINSDQEHKISDESNQARAYRAMPDIYSLTDNPFLYADPQLPGSMAVSVLPEGGIYQKTTYKMRSYYGRLTANFSRVFNNVHIVNLFGGAEANSQSRTNTFFNGWGMQYTIGEIPFYTADFFRKGINENEQYYSLENTYTRSAAFFANATYSYNRRYIVNLTGRYDGTNRLGRARQSRWLPTWNVSGAWNVSEEKFWKPLEHIASHAVLKLSYSLTGDPGPANVTNALADIRYYTPYRPQTGTQENGLRIMELANSELTYEKKHEFNVGLELGFLNNRINFAGDFYVRNNYDLIGMIQTEGVGGQMLKLANVAEMKSKGAEFTLSTKNIAGKDFSWHTNLIFSHATTEVTKLKTKAEAMELIVGEGFALEGYPARGLFSFRSEGLNEIGIPVIVNQDGKATTNGFEFDLRTQNLDNLVYEGPTDPTYTGSLGNIFRYRNLRLNVFITYAFGNVVRLAPVFRSSYSDLDAMPKEFADRWTLAGDERSTRVPVILSADQDHRDVYLRKLYNIYNYTTDRVTKGDFIRMKEISLTYDFPKTLIKRIGLADLSMKVQATNLFLIYADSKLNGQDPEFFRSGGVSAPMPKQFTFTLNMGI